MKYIVTINPKSRITIYAEVNDKFVETRKIELANGDLLGFAGSDIEFHETTLLKQPLLSLSELNALPDMEAFEIDKEEFEELWQQVMELAFP